MARAKPRPSESAKHASWKKKPKRYTALYRDVDGAERSAGTFSTEGKALAEAIKYEAAANEGTRHDPKSGKQTFDTYAWSVFDSKRSWREGTSQRDKSHLRNHLVPLFGSIQLRHLTTPLAQVRINRLTDEKGLAPWTVKEIRRIAWGIMEKAVKAGIVSANCFTDVETPPVIPKERVFLDYDQIEALAEAMLGDEDRHPSTGLRDRAMVYLGAYLGLRPSELLGIKKPALDLNACHARVVGTIEKATGRYVPLTKSDAGRRSIPIPKELVDVVLKPYARDAGPVSAYFFPNEQGGHSRLRQLGAAVVEQGDSPGWP